MKNKSSYTTKQKLETTTDTLGLALGILGAVIQHLELIDDEVNDHLLHCVSHDVSGLQNTHALAMTSGGKIDVKSFLPKLQQFENAMNDPITHLPLTLPAWLDEQRTEYGEAIRQEALHRAKPPKS